MSLGGTVDAPVAVEAYLFLIQITAAATRPIAITPPRMLPPMMSPFDAGELSRLLQEKLVSFQVYPLLH